MKALAVGIRRIQQIDNYTFEVEWTDGRVMRYRLNELQKACPCAHCVDERTGERIVQPSSISETVKARRIYSVGRYALRIEFTSGCSTGIYSYEFLHQRGRE